MLEAQVLAAYTNGGQERTKLLLNQHDPATLGRLLAFYRYFSDFRGKNIKELNAVIDSLQQLTAAADAEERRLAGLAREQYAELSELAAAQAKRQQNLVALNTRIAEEGSAVARLGRRRTRRGLVPMTEIPKPQAS